MSDSNTYFFVLVMVTLLVVHRSVRMLSPEGVWVVERLGKFHQGPLAGGVLLLYPFVDSVRNIKGETAVVSGGWLRRGEPGKVTIYGRDMDAVWSDKAGVQEAAAGTSVCIAGMKDGKLIVEMTST
jgi:hypothetical protein